MPRPMLIFTADASTDRLLSRRPMHMIRGRKRETVICQREGRGWSSDDLARFATHPEDGVAMGFGDKRLHRGVGGRVKERTGHRDLGDVLR